MERNQYTTKLCATLSEEGHLIASGPLEMVQLLADNPDMRLALLAETLARKEAEETTCRERPTPVCTPARVLHDPISRLATDVQELAKQALALAEAAHSAQQSAHAAATYVTALGQSAIVATQERA